MLLNIISLNDNTHFYNPGKKFNFKTEILIYSLKKNAVNLKFWALLTEFDLILGEKIVLSDPIEFD